MLESTETILETVKQNLLIVTREAEVQHSTELAVGSEEMKIAEAGLDRLIGRAKKKKRLKLCLGDRAVTALKLQAQNGKLAPVHEQVSGGNHELLDKYTTLTDTFSSGATEPFYGDVYYFDLPTIGLVLEDGGDLVFTKD
jgi:hypothetical protein